ncbi:unnamed protein product [Bursaphelenchus xylophilus]|uniref:(pine wood nematode) hypothetical protein n=1 Tax=Bursaphelenchus xylophilus TaxID=6326 RepID=A0A1I7S2E0_BURXY|nr:unnamed protein product [Bursaphelenchus xylophilus]CAG9114635.1 unnamed protein product [Bursaphelenchus xylophilus]
MDSKPCSSSSPSDDNKSVWILDKLGELEYIQEFDQACFKDCLGSLEKIMNESEDLLKETRKYRSKKNTTKLNGLLRETMRHAVGLIVFTKLFVPQEPKKCSICKGNMTKNKEPLYCLQCIQPIGCKNCMCEWTKNFRRELIRCFKCQKKSFKKFPLFYHCH